MASISSGCRAAQSPWLCQMLKQTSLNARLRPAGRLAQPATGMANGVAASPVSSMRRWIMGEAS